MKKNDVIIAVVIIAALIAGTAAIILNDTTGKNGSGLSEEYDYDLSAYKKSSEQMLYDQIPQKLITDLKQSKVIIHNGKDKLFIGGDSKILIYNISVNSSADGFNSDLAKSIELSSMPTSLAVDGEDKIYAGLEDHIGVFDAEGKQIDVWESLGSKALITGIAVHKDNVFAADAGNRIVIRYDKDGKIINEIGRKNEKRNIEGFVIPSPYFDLAVASDGLLRVVNSGMHRIEAYTFDGDLEFWWGKPGVDLDEFCGCCNPVNFAILPDKSFVTVEKGLTRIKIFDETGKFSGMVASTEMLTKGQAAAPCKFPEDCQKGAFDLAVDNKGNIYMLNTIENVVRIFVPKSGEENV